MVGAKISTIFILLLINDFLDILPQLKYMGFLATSVTAIETIRFNGLTVTRQLVDAPTKAFWLLIFAIHPTT